MARQRIDAPPATPPLYSLVIAAPDVSASITDDVWGAGFQFAPEACGNSGRVPVDCFGHNGQRPAENNAPIIDGDPFLVWSTDKCSTLGYNGRDFEARATRQLAASESFQIADELWGGELTQAEGLGNRWLTDSSSDTVTPAVGGGVDPVAALALLVGALGACGHGQTGMIHVTPQVLILLAAEMAVYRDGNLWRTPMGHRVVADAGYDGSGPGGAPATSTQWAYATSDIRVARGPVDIPGTIADRVDRDVNSIVVYAQRMALYEWSSECCHLAAEINVPVPATGPPS